jgi:HEAT repeat protein
MKGGRMKKLWAVYAFLAIVVLLVTSMNAETITEMKKDNAVKNLSVGLSSDNSGLRISSALVLSHLVDLKYLNGEKAETLLLPLMKMLSNGNSDEERIAAALALFKIGDNRGIYRLKGSAKFDKSKRVKDICRKLYLEYNKQNRTEYLLNN